MIQPAVEWLEHVVYSVHPDNALMGIAWLSWLVLSIVGVQPKKKAKKK